MTNEKYIEGRHHPEKKTNDINSIYEIGTNTSVFPDLKKFFLYKCILDNALLPIRLYIVCIPTER